MSRIVKSFLVCVLLALLSSSVGMAALSDEGEATSSDLDGPQMGPLLLPLNPPYLNRPAEDRAIPLEGDLPAEEPMGEEEEEAELDVGSTPPETPAKPKVKTKKELTPAMAALRDRVRRTLALYRRQMPSTRTNTVTEVMFYCMAFGCNAEVQSNVSSSKKSNGITCLCWNLPCAGYEPLVLAEGRIAARIGYGLQERRGQLLAVLGLSRVPATYPIRVDEDNVRTVADLVEHEKLGCRSGTDLSLKLIGLSYYVADDSSWKNGLGEDWSVQRIVEEEIKRPVANSTAEGISQLTGLGYAICRRGRRKQPMEGSFLKAQKFIHEYQDYALAVQNREGGWGPRYLASREVGRDSATQLCAGGHVLQWLVLSLPDDRLEEPGVVRAVEHVNRLLGNHRSRGGFNSLRSREVGSMMRAVHALVAYDERCFAGRTISKPASTQQAARQGTVGR